MKTREQVITEFKKDMGVKDSYTLTDDENYFVDKIVEAYNLVKESDSLPPVSEILDFARYVQDNYFQNAEQGSAVMLPVGIMRKEFTSETFTFSEIYKEYKSSR